MNFEDCEFAIRLGESSEGFFLQTFLIYCPNRLTANRLRRNYKQLANWNRKFGSREILIYWWEFDRFEYCARPYQIPFNMPINLLDLVPVEIEELRQEELRRLQFLLSEAGFFLGNLDGEMSRGLKEAFRAFVLENSLKPEKDTTTLTEERFLKLRSKALEIDT